MSTGTAVGQIPPKQELNNPGGVTYQLHDFCNHTVLIVAGGINSATAMENGQIAANLLDTDYTDGRVRVVYLFNVNASGMPVSNADMAAVADTWGVGFAKYGVPLSDSNYFALRAYIPIPENSIEGSMLLKPGFEIVKINIPASAYKTEIDAVLNPPPAP